MNSISANWYILTMTEYVPHKWVVVKIINSEHEPIHKVFANWFGDYLNSDSWQLNSGITKVIKEGSDYCFHGYSGSIYRCNEINYGTTMYGASIIAVMIERVESNGGTIEILPEDTNWLEIDYD